LNEVSLEVGQFIGSRRIPANFLEYYEKWQVMIRTAPPRRWSIFKPWIDISNCKSVSNRVPKIAFLFQAGDIALSSAPDP
jgi:hypothetical protein